MSFFDATLTSGIQDISAILPLLGTEQVEHHIGSALTGGFLYAAACPMSLFGSLGAVRIAFTVLVATCTGYRRSSQNSWIGARWLADAGFSVTGDVARLIGSPEAYLFGKNVLTKTGVSKVYLAEAKLTSLIDNLHIDNVEKLSVRVKPGLFYWNLGLVVSSLFFSAMGITPYIYLFHHSTRLPGSAPLWIYPLMRTVGTMMVVVSSQFIIQLRLLQILRSYITFLSLTKLHQGDIYKLLNTTSEESREKTAEELIRQLKRHLSNSSACGQTDTIFQIEDLISQEKKHGVSPVTRNFLIFFGIMIIIGGLATVVGYIGSFTVVQSASNGAGPLIWLAMEGSLSLIRILIWGSNPGFDDNDGLEFVLDTSPNKPLLTCIKSEAEIDDEKLLPLKQSNTFLRELASYIGPVEPFTRSGFSVYYTVTGAITSELSKPGITIPNASGSGSYATPQRNDDSPRILYMTVYDDKEQASSFTVKIVDLADRRGWKFFKVQTAQGNTLQVRMGAEMETKDNVFTNDPDFLDELQSHCRELAGPMNSIHIPGPDPDKLAWFRVLRQKVRNFNESLSGRPKTRSPSPVGTLPTHRPALPSFYLEYNSNWSLVLQTLNKERNMDLGKLSASEKGYLKHGDLERKARSFFHYSGWWNTSQMTLVRDELSRERPPVRSAAGFYIGDKLIINEIEHLLFAEGFAMEDILARHFMKTELDLSQRRECMVQEILTHRQEPFKIGSKSENDILLADLSDQNKKAIDNRSHTVKEASLSRLSQQRTSAIERLESQEYRDNYDKAVTTRWRTDSRERETMVWNVPPADFGSEFQAFQRRLSEVQTSFFKEVIHEPGVRREVTGNLAFATRWCTARWEALKLRRQMEQDCDADLERVKTRVFHQIEGEGLAEETAREHIASMVRIMRSKYTRFLDISDDLIKQTGTLDLLLDLIQYNEVATVITVSSDSALEMETRIVEVVEKMPNVTHYGGWGTQITATLPSLSDRRVSERLKQGLPVITYADVTVAEDYRRSNPYLIFDSGGSSFCNVLFQVASQIPTSKVLLLAHRGTRIQQGQPTTIQITVKSHRNADSTDDTEQTFFDRTYSRHLNHDNFAQQRVQIDNLGLGTYDLKIMLDTQSGAVYWLDYVEFTDLEESYLKHQEYPELKPED